MRIVFILMFGLVIQTINLQADESSDVEVLTGLLEDFLAGASVSDPSTHREFWSEDLIYTSSDGTRFGKAEILQGLEQDHDGDEAPDAVSYRAEDVQVRPYGEVAVVAFRLVGVARDGGQPPQQYFNTGTFVRHDSRWQAVAWQATRIPGTD